ncbi:hypothetical protein EXIGLDRAFT_829860 [Exidia glandulosa HHB12029]|uniref:Uncharacterized protein n=1 Tax=Exidia glandulosa HHB12029 TaxID=1314781 RepID=A0A165P4M1_EXIGL|nr:hypothetical protein EXIGLDRAFT_829860 [Exidia glandulosa HHB12029]
MTGSWLQLLRQRLQADSDALAELDVYAAKVQLERTIAKSTLADAQAALNALDDEVQRADARRVILQSSINDLRNVIHTSSSSSIGRLPDETLTEIFLALVSGDDPEWTYIGIGGFNSHRARMPFTLSSVCRRWRDIAITQKALWTYCGVPVIHEHHRPTNVVAHLRRVKTLLSRSRDAPLHVLLVWGMAAVWTPASYTHLIFEAIMAHMDHWRVAEIWLPQTTGEGASPWKSFQGSTPLLEEMLIRGSDTVSWTSSDRPYLPHCPRLRSLWVLQCPVIPRICASALQKLQLRVEAPTHRLWAALQAAAQTLESLSLNKDTPSQDNEPPATLLAFPSLKGLSLAGKGASMMIAHGTGRIALPVLERLALDTSMLDELEIFLQTHCKRVRTLAVRRHPVCELQSRQANQLRPLTRVRTVSLDASVHEQFFVAATSRSRSPWMWPELEELSLNKFTETNFEALPAYFRARNAAADAGGDGAPGRVKMVKFCGWGGSWRIPGWVKGEVRHLLGQENVEEEHEDADNPDDEDDEEEEDDKKEEDEKK